MKFQQRFQLKNKISAHLVLYILLKGRTLIAFKLLHTTKSFLQYYVSLYMQIAKHYTLTNNLNEGQVPTLAKLIL